MLLALLQCTRSNADLGRADECAAPQLHTTQIDQILSIDAIISSDGALNLVWLQLTHTPGGQDFRYATWFCRNDPSQTTWSDPIELSEGDIQAPRLVAVGSTLHVLVGERLRHFISTDGGGVWSERSSLIPSDDSVRCLAFKYDVCAIDSTIYAAYLGYSPVDKRRLSELRLVRWRPSGGEASRLIGRHKGHLKAQGEPRLHRQGDALFLACTANSYDTKDVVDARGERSRVMRDVGNALVYVSRDAGLSWEAPHPLPDPVASNGPWRRVTSLGWARLEGRNFLLFDSAGSLHALEFDGRAFRAARTHVAGPRVDVLSAFDPRGFDVTSTPRGVYLAWAELLPTSNNVNPWAIPPRILQARLNRLGLVDNSVQVGPAPEISSGKELLQALRIVSDASGMWLVWSGASYTKQGADGALNPPRLSVRRVATP